MLFKGEIIMPGILYHLSFAEEVYRKLASDIFIDKISFLGGNLIPDLAKDKNNSHYSTKASLEGFIVPKLTDAKRDLYKLTDSIKFGMYCHLYLDYYFIEEYLIPEFIWDIKKMKVTNPRNNKQWNIKTFLSASGMYDAYTEINCLLIRDGRIPINTIMEIPEILPNTGIPVFDVRRDKTWRRELYEYLAQKKEYTGEIFDYDRLWSFIKRIAIQFVQEM